MFMERYNYPSLTRELAKAVNNVVNILEKVIFFSDIAI